MTDLNRLLVSPSLPPCICRVNEEEKDTRNGKKNSGTSDGRTPVETETPTTRNRVRQKELPEYESRLDVSGTLVWVRVPRTSDRNFTLFARSLNVPAKRPCLVRIVELFSAGKSLTPRCDPSETADFPVCEQPLYRRPFSVPGGTTPSSRGRTLRLQKRPEAPRTRLVFLGPKGLEFPHQRARLLKSFKRVRRRTASGTGKSMQKDPLSPSPVFFPSIRSTVPRTVRPPPLPGRL